MKQCAAMLLTLVLFYSCNSEKRNYQSDLEESNLKGKIRKVEKTIHNADEKITTCPCGEKEECKQTLTVYNEKGKLTESVTLDIDGKILVTSRYIYNRQDLCKEIDRYTGKNLVGKEVNIFHGGQLKEVKVFNADGAAENVYTYEYSGGAVLSGTTLDDNGEIIGAFHNEYLNGQLDSQTKKDKNGNITLVTKYMRNANNDVTESIFTYPLMNTEYKMKFDYEYDNQGNWIKQIQIYNGEIVTIITRNITYYHS